MPEGPQAVSFTIRRPSPPESRGISPGASDPGHNFKIPALPRHLAGVSNDSTPLEYDSSDEEDQELQDELVSGFDKFGVERADGRSRKTQDAPLVIPALKNKDWREAARKRRGHFVPDAGKAGTGTDGSVGGLGTRDTINSGPVLSGLHVRRREREAEAAAPDGDIVMEEQAESEVEETEEQRALRAILAEANGTRDDGATIAAIPTPISEAEAFQQDIGELPESATMSDYERVPVSQFGAALLRGMGWKEGMAASRKPGKGMVEPYLPASRPALLGIGAKEQEVLDDGSKRKHKKPAEKYMPVVKMDRSGSNRDRERSRSPNRSSTRSRRSSRSPDRGSKSGSYPEESRHRREKDYERSRDKGRDRERDRDRDEARDRDRDRDRKDRRDYDRDRQRESDRDRSYKRSDSSRGSNKRDY
ncbi:hypothetical protein EST38_g4535 [Candolleomyces aberdarensis]|uniref:G-patch domain-containing protein n=1 Tax=Candolleomyces aberdarensis TaxID=2316362 RepID=A0A4Q2DR05_9AGAR|nr:hypothetical protein EST38_g4535 [Candolleomyces aberdarensis]